MYARLQTLTRTRHAWCCSNFFIIILGKWLSGIIFGKMTYHVFFMSGKWLLLVIFQYLLFRENDSFDISGKCRDTLFCTFRSLPAVSYLKVPFFNLLYAICFFELFFFPGDWHIQPCFNFLRFPEHTAGKGPSWSYQKSSLQFCAGHINVQH